MDKHRDEREMRDEMREGLVCCEMSERCVRERVGMQTGDVAEERGS